MSSVFVQQCIIFLAAIWLSIAIRTRFRSGSTYPGLSSLVRVGFRQTFCHIARTNPRPAYPKLMACHTCTKKNIYSYIYIYIYIERERGLSNYSKCLNESLFGNYHIIFVLYANHEIICVIIYTSEHLYLSAPINAILKDSFSIFFGFMTST